MDFEKHSSGDCCLYISRFLLTSSSAIEEKV